MLPVTSMELSLPGNESIDTFDGEVPRVFIPEMFLIRLTTLKLKCDWEGNSILATLQFCAQVSKT
jgi:hypothetical protein